MCSERYLPLSDRPRIRDLLLRTGHSRSGAGKLAPFPLPIPSRHLSTIINAASNTGRIELQSPGPCNSGAYRFNAAAMELVWQSSTATTRKRTSQDKFPSTCCKAEDLTVYCQYLVTTVAHERSDAIMTREAAGQITRSQSSPFKSPQNRNQKSTPESQVRIQHNCKNTTPKQC